MNNTPFFSIIIPCYNVSNSIGPTLDSIKIQDFNNFEIIFVNDGSTDNTLDILNDYKSTNNTSVIIINQKNRGLGSARNTGIKVSKGKYIALLDADDTWFYNKLSTVYKVIINNNQSELFCHNENVIDKNGKFLKKNYYGTSTTFENLIYNGNCLSPSAVILNRNVFQIVGYFSEDRNYHGVEDYDFWLRASLKSIHFFYLKEFLGNYIIHDTNMSTSLTFINIEEKLLLNYIYNYNSTFKNRYKIKKRLFIFYLRKKYLYLKNNNYTYLFNFYIDIFYIIYNEKSFIKKRISL